MKTHQIQNKNRNNTNSNILDFLHNKFRKEKRGKDNSDKPILKSIKCPTLHIPDDPSNIDLFGNAHKSIADAITKFIITTKVGHTIGIEGNWGSGKSTIVHLIIENFIKDKNTKTIVFDAWSHEGDPLRRVFLLRLIEQVKEWIPKNEFKGLKDRIRGLSGSTTKESNKIQISVLWIFTTISILLVPIGIELIKEQINNVTLRIADSNGPNFGFIIGLVIFIFFLLMIVVTYFLYKKDPNKYGINFFQIPSQFVPETITVNPCSIDFEETFQEIIKAACKDVSRRIIIIIDNIDRIDIEVAKQILITLQTFIDHDNDKTDKYKNLWVIIPYDFKGLLGVWENNGQHENRALAFLAKRIETNFLIPPLIPSKWTTFFRNKIQEEFPQHKDIKQFDKILDIYKKFLSDNTQEPNPREIIRFINQIGTYHIIWEDEIPLEGIADFVCNLILKKAIFFSQKNDVKLETLLQAELMKGYIDIDQKKNLLALYYSLDKNSAFERHFESAFRDLLSMGSVEEIENFHMINPEGFWNVFDEFDFDQLPKQNPFHEICNLNKLLEKLTTDEYRNQKICEKVKQYILQIPDWSFINTEILSDLGFLLSSFSEKEKRKLFSRFGHIEYINDKISNTPNGGKADDGLLKSWFTAVLSFLRKPELLISNNDYSLILPFSEKGLFQFFCLLGEFIAEKDLFHCFKTEIDSISIRNEVISCITDKKLYEENIYLFPIISNLQIDIDWEEIITAINHTLTTSDPTSLQSDILFFILISVNKSYENAKNHLSSITKSNRMLEIIHSKIGSTKQIALNIFCIINFGNDQILKQSSVPAGISNSLATIHNIFSNPSSSPEIISNYVEIYIKYSTIEELFLILDRNDLFYKFCLEILKIILDNDDFRQKLTTDLFLANWKTIKLATTTDLFQKIIMSDDSIEKKISQSIFNIQDIELYIDIIETYGNKLPSSLFQNWKKYLLSLDQLKWDSIFENPGELFDLLIKLNSKCKPLKLSIPYIKSLQNVICEYINSSKISQSVIDNWTILKTSYPDKASFIDRKSVV